MKFTRRNKCECCHVTHMLLHGEVLWRVARFGLAIVPLFLVVARSLKTQQDRTFLVNMWQC